MIKKDDLVKKFELLTKQEIKNYNDSLLVTNTSLGDLDRRISVLRDSFGAKIEILQSELGKRDTRISALEDHIKKLESEFDRYVNDKQKLYERDAIYREEYREALEKLFDMYSKMNIKTNNIFDEIGSSSSKLSKQNEQALTETLTFKIRLANHIKEVKELFHAMPPVESIVEEKICEKLSVVEIDKKGIQREIDIAKKRCFIIEKEIENIYTRIERLKGSG